MKTYESLKLDIIHFEAQDVVTASVVLDTNCVCRLTADYVEYYYHYDDFNNPCTADVHNHTNHDNCRYAN